MRLLMDGKEGGQDDELLEVELNSRRKCSSGRHEAASKRQQPRGAARCSTSRSSLNDVNEERGKSSNHNAYIHFFTPLPILFIIMARLRCHTAHTRRGGGRAQLARLGRGAAARESEQAEPGVVLRTKMI